MDEILPPPRAQNNVPDLGVCYCPHCGTEIINENELSAKMVRCPDCAKLFVMPVPEATLTPRDAVQAEPQARVPLIPTRRVTPVRKARFPYGLLVGAIAGIAIGFLLGNGALPVDIPALTKGWSGEIPTQFQIGNRVYRFQFTQAVKFALVGVAAHAVLGVCMTLFKSQPRR